MRVPPGSRVQTTRSPCSSSQVASRWICVVFPAPSMPSNVMNVPRLSVIAHLNLIAKFDAYKRLSCGPKAHQDSNGLCAHQLPRPNRRNARWIGRDRALTDAPCRLCEWHEPPCRLFDLARAKHMLATTKLVQGLETIRM